MSQKSYQQQKMCEQLSKTLSTRMNQFNFTVASLARKAQISQRTIRKYLGEGDEALSLTQIDTLRKICLALNCSLDFLLGLNLPHHTYSRDEIQFSINVINLQGHVSYTVRSTIRAQETVRSTIHAFYLPPYRCPQRLSYKTTSGPCLIPISLPDGYSISIQDKVPPVIQLPGTSLVLPIRFSPALTSDKTIKYQCVFATEKLYPMTQKELREYINEDCPEKLKAFGRKWVTEGYNICYPTGKLNFEITFPEKFKIQEAGFEVWTNLEDGTNLVAQDDVSLDLQDGNPEQTDEAEMQRLQKGNCFKQEGNRLSLAVKNPKMNSLYMLKWYPGG